MNKTKWIHREEKKITLNGETLKCYLYNICLLAKKKINNEKTYFGKNKYIYFYYIYSMLINVISK